MFYMQETHQNIQIKIIIDSKSPIIKNVANNLTLTDTSMTDRKKMFNLLSELWHAYFAKSTQ